MKDRPSTASSESALAEASATAIMSMHTSDLNSIDIRPLDGALDLADRRGVQGDF